jgi:mannose-6-phosphate isomerase-like protein (cupin superfamily)
MKKSLVVHETEGIKLEEINRESIILINPETAGSVHMTFGKITVRPGEGSPRHYHAKTEEIYYIMSGSGKIVIDDKPYPVGPGHSILVPQGARHELTNTGNENLVYLCVDSPVFNPQDVFVEQK